MRHSRTVRGLVALAFIAALSAPAVAGPSDAGWVAKCVRDSKDEKAEISVITAYCVCMNDKMDDDETLSITAWEKTHPKERQACDKESGWK